MNKALFLDRDGIINVDHGYVYKKEEFEFIEDIFDVCHHTIAKGYKIFVITNQSGIGRGKYTEAEFKELTKWMIAEFKVQGVIIDDVYFCPHHPTNALGDYLVNCDCRKPAPGMILKAALEHKLDLSQSIFIGDKASDIQAAEAAGIEERILVASHYQDELNVTAYKIDNIAQAKSYIC